MRLKGFLWRKRNNRSINRQLDEMDRYRYQFDRKVAELKATRIKDDIEWLKLEQKVLMKKRLEQEPMWKLFYDGKEVDNGNIEHSTRVHKDQHDDRTAYASVEELNKAGWRFGSDDGGEGSVEQDEESAGEEMRPDNSSKGKRVSVPIRNGKRPVKPRGNRKGADKRRRHIPRPGKEVQADEDGKGTGTTTSKQIEGED